MNTWKPYMPGVALTGVIACAAYFLGTLFPLIGGAVFGIIAGILFNNVRRKPKSTVAGVRFCSKKVLQWAIIALGCHLSLTEVWKTGSETFAVMLVTLLLSFAAAYLFGRVLRVPARLAILIGAGTGICGGSAIAAISPLIQAEDDEIAYSIAAIFMFNVAAVLLFPMLGHLMGMSDGAFGLWAGTAVNDTSSVVAVGYAYSADAGNYATIVKLTRTTMIIPMAFAIALFAGVSQKRREATVSAAATRAAAASGADTAVAGAATNTVSADAGRKFSWLNIFPWFIVWFVAASLFNTLGLFGDTAQHIIQTAAQFMIVMALTAVGLSTDLRSMLKSGVKPLLLGLIVWVVVAVSSLVVQHMTGQL
ncbi:YeiH family protein [Paenibacillus thalictri]|uniref:Putative sulfate exporter family transporter n=1 Tax=Paenibacillus thalictri TaxID=2527873 RepID=A0A4V2J4F0_9BACL|nr:putative sulfate exporter family transporter [Paenibacillus thalictri]TBL79532.1 putative sulfate exporter family transporter [Paenibacillus thalictri]